MKTQHAFATVVALLVAAAACPAALITTNELEMDTIFSQASFGGATVDIRFNSAVTVVDPTLVTIDSESELLSLLAQGPGSSPTVNLFFVDGLDWCGSYNHSIVGCATLPGHDIVVESAMAAGVFGGELSAHELGHNLGLPHTSTGLMSHHLGGDTTLTSAEVSTILASPLIQMDGAQRFVSITPVLVAAVPEPSSWVLACIVAVGLGYFGHRHRRRTLGISHGRNPQARPETLNRD